jgi:glycosyltransferase involved in cell wall biosynthesis
MSTYSLIDKSKLPSVAVIVATLGKRNELLEKTLQSIATQKVPKLGIIMVYPLANKETARLAKKYNAISLDDTGSMSSAVNKGFRYAWDSFDYLTWIGDDDLILPDSLQHSISALEAHKSAIGAYGYCQYINGAGDHLFLSKAGRLAMYIAPWGPNLMPLPGSVYRSSGLQTLEYIFDETLKYSMDLDLFLRLIKRKALISIKFPVAAFRWHENSTTVSSRTLSLSEAAATKRRYLSRPATHLAPLWEFPLRLLTHIAQSRIGKK